MPETRRRTYADAKLVAVILAAALGCAAQAAPGPAPAPVCLAGDTVLVRETLYFGRNRPGGGTVSDAEWQSFLDQVLTARFPAGLTVVDATGQWRGRSGVVEREQSAIVTVFHSGDSAARTAVREVTLEYKRRFRQEAVLRERASTCAAFE